MLLRKFVTKKKRIRRLALKDKIISPTTQVYIIFLLKLKLLLNNKIYSDLRK
jgi:hypothetical protein